MHLCNTDLTLIQYFLEKVYNWEFIKNSEHKNYGGIIHKLNNVENVKWFKHLKILPYQRPENSGSQTVMQNKVMKGITMLEQTRETYAGGMGEVINQVAGYKNAKNALGYTFMYYSTQMIRNHQYPYSAEQDDYEYNFIINK